MTDLLLAKWIGYKKNNIPEIEPLLSSQTGRYTTSLEEKVKNKFDQKGFFKCKMEDGIYTKIIFGDPISFDTWIKICRAWINIL